MRTLILFLASCIFAYAQGTYQISVQPVSSINADSIVFLVGNGQATLFKDGHAKRIPSLNNSTNGKFLSNNGSAFVWQTIAGGGDLLSSNNLSDVGNAATARINLGLGNVDNTSDATKNSATATLTNKTISGANNTLTNIPQSAITNYAGYSIAVQALTSSPADAATVYFGMLPKAPVTAAATSKVYVRQAGTITAAEIYCYSGTAGTNENWSLYVRVNNATDYLIQTVSTSANERVFSNSSLSISLNAGDYFEIKGVQPTWATNPATTIYGGYIRIN